MSRQRLNPGAVWLERVVHGSGGVPERLKFLERLDKGLLLNVPRRRRRSYARAVAHGVEFVVRGNVAARAKLLSEKKGYRGSRKGKGREWLMTS
jgi:hypothetical protein